MVDTSGIYINICDSVRHIICENSTGYICYLTEMQLILYFLDTEKFLRPAKHWIKFSKLTKIINLMQCFLKATQVYVEAWNIYKKYNILSKIIIMWPDF